MGEIEIRRARFVRTWTAQGTTRLTVDVDFDALPCLPSRQTLTHFRRAVPRHCCADRTSPHGPRGPYREWPPSDSIPDERPV